MKRVTMMKHAHFLKTVIQILANILFVKLFLTDQ